ncbi:unnamed protein product [Gadus morhua 'NCC']
MFKRPRVSLLQRTPSSPVVCHATGFYPDRVVVFWRRDGQELHEQVDPGEVLPNHDGTFQVSVDLDLTAVPQEDWGRYECVVGGRRSEPVLWPGHMGLQVGGQSPSSGRVTWGSRWEVRGQSPSSGRVTWGSRWKVRGQSPSSERVTWGSRWEVRGQSPCSGRVTWGSRWEVRGQSPVLWPGHMGLQVGGQRSEPVLLAGSQWGSRWEVRARPLAGSHGAPGGRSEVRARPLGRVTWGSRWSRVKRQRRHQRHNT